MFCYDKPIPEEVIDEPVGLSSISEIEIGDNKRCTCCEAKGALLCATCSGTGLYVDSIMESQGIIVKVRCLGNLLIHNASCRHVLYKLLYIHQKRILLVNVVGCGGTGNTMCKSCGWCGHVGH
ncbi:unnamed protein product [Cochlearia groenlandica]